MVSKKVKVYKEKKSGNLKVDHIYESGIDLMEVRTPSEIYGIGSNSQFGIANSHLFNVQAFGAGIA